MGRPWLPIGCPGGVRGPFCCGRGLTGRVERQVLGTTPCFERSRRMQRAHPSSYSCNIRINWPARNSSSSSIEGLKSSCTRWTTLLAGPPAAAIAAEVLVCVGVFGDSEDMLNSVPAGLGGPMKGPALVKSIGLGPFPRFEAPRVRPGAAEIATAVPTVAPIIAPLLALGGFATDSTTGLVISGSVGAPLALTISMVFAWSPKGLAELWDWLVSGRCCCIGGRAFSLIGTADAVIRAFPLLARFSIKLGMNWVTGRSDKRGAVALVRILGARAEDGSANGSSCFSLSARAACFVSLRLLKT